VSWLQKYTNSIVSVTSKTFSMEVYYIVDTMSKIWKLPVLIPTWVTVSLDERIIKVKWPKGELSYVHRPEVMVHIDEDQLLVTINNMENKKYRGLTRTLINNMVEWVTNAYEKKLKVIGVGYDAKLQGNKLVLSLGFSHPIEYSIPQWVNLAVAKDPKWNAIITADSIDKQLLGQVVAQIRNYRPPEPYKGKGIRYFDEKVRLKAGKSAKK